MSDGDGQWDVEKTASDFWYLHLECCEAYPKLADRISFPKGLTSSSATPPNDVDAVDRLRLAAAKYLQELADIQLYGSNLEELWLFLGVFEHLTRLRALSQGADAAALAEQEMAAAAAAASMDALSSRKHRGPCLQKMHEMALSDPQGFQKLRTVSS